MIWRKIEKRLEAFYKANGRYALLVDGARQVGKTYSIEEFGRTHYDSVVKIDFVPIYNQVSCQGSGSLSLHLKRIASGD